MVMLGIGFIWQETPNERRTLVDPRPERFQVGGQGMVDVVVALSVDDHLLGPCVEGNGQLRRSVRFGTLQHFSCLIPQGQVDIVIEGLEFLILFFVPVGSLFHRFDQGAAGGTLFVIFAQLQQHPGEQHQDQGKEQGVPQGHPRGYGQGIQPVPQFSCQLSEKSRPLFTL